MLWSEPELRLILVRGVAVSSPCARRLARHRFPPSKHSWSPRHRHAPGLPPDRTRRESKQVLEKWNSPAMGSSGALVRTFPAWEKILTEGGSCFSRFHAMGWAQLSFEGTQASADLG